MVRSNVSGVTDMWTDKHGGGSRISLRWGRQLSRGERQHTILPNLPKKLHEIERIFTLMGGGARTSRPLDPLLKQTRLKTLPSRNPANKLNFGTDLFNSKCQPDLLTLIAMEFNE